jgi:tetratricopeptide (TPR) repeat protein
MNRETLLEDAWRHYRAGALDDARNACERLLQANAADAEALNLMGAIAADERKTEEGLRWARRAAAADPAAAAPHYTMGRLCQGEGRLAEAEAHYRRSLELEADQPKALNNLGAVLHMQGRLDLAVASYRRALELDPALPQANQNLASITRERGAAENAIAGFLRQLQQNPGDAQTHTDLGNVYRELGRHREAIESFARAIECDPQLAEAHFARSFELLLSGNYREGFEDFEWRWRVKALNTPMRKFPQPLWDGRPLDGALLLHAEQGFGDTLHAVRYAEAAAARAREVIVECQRELLSLVQSVRGVSRALPQGAPLPELAAHLPLMSLPRVFGTRLESVPWSGAYLHASPADVERWRPRLAVEARLKVGLAWAGQPQQGDDRKRSIALSMLAPLASVPDVAFFSLQKGDAARQAADPPAGMRLAELGSRFADFSDTAAAISQLDLVVTIDTSVAHLAGAMGAPTWVLVAAIPDWRYGLEREGTPWYPTMRLFRQQADGDWAGVVERVAQALRSASKPFR